MLSIEYFDNPDFWCFKSLLGFKRELGFYAFGVDLPPTGWASRFGGALRLRFYISQLCKRTYVKKPAGVSRAGLMRLQYPPRAWSLPPGSLLEQNVFQRLFCSCRSSLRTSTHSEITAYEYIQDKGQNFQVKGDYYILRNLKWRK